MTWPDSSREDDTSRRIVDMAQLAKIIDIACGMVKLVERIRQDARHESSAATSFMLWLKSGRLNIYDRLVWLIEY